MTDKDEQAMEASLAAEGGERGGWPPVGISIYRRAYRAGYRAGHAREAEKLERLARAVRGVLMARSLWVERELRAALEEVEK